MRAASQVTNGLDPHNCIRKTSVHDEEIVDAHVACWGLGAVDAGFVVGGPLAELLRLHIEVACYEDSHYPAASLPLRDCGHIIFQAV